MKSPESPKFDQQQYLEAVAGQNEDLARLQTAIGDEQGHITPEAAQSYLEYQAEQPQPVELYPEGDVRNSVLSKNPVVDPRTGNAVNRDSYLDGRRAELSRDQDDQNAYENMSISQLAKALGQAEFHGDKTTAGNISDILLHKMSDASEKLSKNNEGASKNFKNAGEPDPQEAFWNRVMRIKDKEISKLEAVSTDPEINRRAYEEAEASGEQVMDLGGAGIVIGDEKDLPKVKEVVDEPHPEVQDVGEAGVKLNIDPENNSGDTQELPKTKGSLFARVKNKVKEAMDKQPAVRFDGKDHNGNKVDGKNVGDAIVDARPREYEARHKAAMIGMGVMAVGLAYLATRGIGGGSDEVAAAMINSKAAKAVSSTSEGIEKVKSMVEADAAVDRIGESVSGAADRVTDAAELVAADYRIESLSGTGDTIWAHVAAELGSDATDAEILKATKEVLDLNGLSWQEARSLPGGYEFKIPENLK